MDGRPLKLALVGYGRMGRAVEAAALARGHQVLSRIDPAAPGATHAALGSAALDGVELALEFTAGPSAPGCPAIWRWPRAYSPAPPSHTRFEPCSDRRGRRSRSSSPSPSARRSCARCTAT